MLLVLYVQVVRVGIAVFCYVALEHADSWVIKIQKNLKGRGVIYDDADTPDELQVRNSFFCENLVYL